MKTLMGKLVKWDTSSELKTITLLVAHLCKNPDVEEVVVNPLLRIELSQNCEDFASDERRLHC
jgi:hypothetical protein